MKCTNTSLQHSEVMDITVGTVASLTGIKWNDILHDRHLHDLRHILRNVFHTGCCNCRLLLRLANQIITLGAALKFLFKAYFWFLTRFIFQPTASV